MEINRETGASPRRRHVGFRPAAIALAAAAAILVGCNGTRPSATTATAPPDVRQIDIYRDPAAYVGKTVIVTAKGLRQDSPDRLVGTVGDSARFEYYFASTPPAPTETTRVVGLFEGEVRSGIYVFSQCRLLD